MLALKLRVQEPAEDPHYDEYWIGDVEPCGEEWVFSVIGPDEAVETFVHASQAAAECDRARVFRTLCPAVAVAVSHS